MDLSTIKANISGAASSTAERVKGNWNNLSTTGKVAAVGVSILLAGAAVAANILGAGLLSAVTVLSVGVSHLIAHIAGAALGVLGLAIPACLLLKNSQAKPIVKEEEQVAVEEKPAQEAVKSSRLVDLKNASVQFVRNHPRLVIAGSVLAITILGAGLMGAERRGTVVSLSRQFGSQALIKGKSVVLASKSSAKAVLVRGQASAGIALSKGKSVALASKASAKAVLVRGQKTLSNLNFVRK